MKTKQVASVVAALALLVACEKPKVVADIGADAAGHSAPTQYTIRANENIRQALPFSDRQDYEDARRGFIGKEPQLNIVAEVGTTIWKPSEYDFIEGAAPASVNPSLWRQADLNNINGLFKVTDRIYQVRGYDLANMSIIEGDSGWIIVDPLTTRQTAAASMALVRKHLGDKPVVAVIFTHSHGDHFAGVLGVVSEEQYRQGNLRIIAPEGFMAEATSENIIAGAAMRRRAMFMYGKELARTKRGHIDSGLGKSPAAGTYGILEPTETIGKTPDAVTIDGLSFVFQYAPESEAPAELTFYLPELKAYCGAEVATHNLHNLYTLRGAKVRDALKWSGYIDEMIDLSADAEVYFASHHWPVWGPENIRDFLVEQRDTYKFIHDQTVRLFSAGLTPREIAEQLKLPASLEKGFSNRGYYGTLKHNSKAVYQGYLGWYDGNPANLDSLPPVEAGKRYVNLAGGADALLSKAQAAYDKGEYRWVAELLNHLVFAEADHRGAKALLANTYDQLGYQAESAPWRDVYLSAAYELRHGVLQENTDPQDMLAVLRHTPVEKIFESMAVRLNSERADGVQLRVGISFSDLNEHYILSVTNSVLHHHRTESTSDSDVSLVLTRSLFVRVMTGAAGLRESLAAGDATIDGAASDLAHFFSLLDRPDGWFNIVTP